MRGKPATSALPLAGRTLWLTALIAILALSAGQGSGQTLGLRVEWQARPAASGSTIAGYVYNDNPTSVHQVRLRLEGLDDAGSVVSTSTGYVFGIVPAFNRTYFEAPAPAASSYRVSVSLFQWFKGGSGGM